MKGLSYTVACIHSLLNPFPVQAGTWPWAEFQVSCDSFLLVIHFKYNSVYMTFPESLTIPSPWQPEVRFLSLWVSFCFVSKFVCIISFYIPHIKDVIWYLSFSVWFASLSRTLSGSIHVLQIALFHSFQWLSNITLYTCTYTTSSLSIPKQLGMDLRQTVPSEDFL